MAYPTTDQLQLQIEAALQDTEIIYGIERSGISKTRLAEMVKDREKEIWNTVAADLEEYNTLEAKISEIEGKNKKIFEAVKLNRTGYFGINWLLFAIELIASAIISFEPLFYNFSYISIAGLLYKNFSNLYIKWILAIILFILLLLLVTWLAGMVRKRILRRYYSRIISEADQEILQEYSLTTDRFKSCGRRLEVNLREKAIKDLMRRIINSQIKHSYSTRLTDIEATGLGEVIDTSKTIDTDAKDKLHFLLNSMPGGSIGIAGARGAGKSTLIETYCGSERSETKINGHKTIPVITTAPVKYEARDFILYLFKATCISVLKEEGGSDYLNFESLTNEHAYGEDFLTENAVYSAIRKMMPGFAIILIVSSIFVKLIFPIIDEHNSTVHKTEFGLSLLGLNFTSGIVSVFLIFGLLTFVTWALWSMIKGDIALEPFSRIIERPATRRKKEALRNQGTLRRQLEDKPHVRSSLDWLKKIKFQQSFTAGWSGTLKLPFALEGGMNKAMTFAERQMSNPEIIAAFKDFLNSIRVDYPVIIGIDEMDKLESDEVAQMFLNEIKSIFGVYRCFFLISVSENAMSNFERRGMPFRDVFDSSLDSIVYVNYFNLNSAKQLLQRRVIGNPITFFDLAFCLAGGLPRDIIRYFREIVRIGVKHNSLAQITQQLICDDVVAKLRAIIQSLKKIDNTAESDSLLALLLEVGQEKFSLLSLENTIKDLNNLLNIILNKNNELRTKIGDENSKIAIPILTSLAIIGKETHAYLCYTVTLWDFFSTNLNQDKIKKLEANGIFDLMANARQALAIDYSIALKQINSCRKKEHLHLLD